MKNSLLLFTTILALLFSQTSFSQRVYGVVLDGDTNKPIEGASVYFDNTSIGVSTDENGEFNLYRNKKIKSPLIISFVGYRTMTHKDFSEVKRRTFYLYESNSVLNDVIINTNDGWSRKLKMKEFLKRFLGETKNGKASYILNKEDIVLRYNKRRKQLTATAKTPIYIKNHNLGYLIQVELKHFEANYSYVSKNNQRKSLDFVYYAGYNFFKSTNEKLSEKTIQNRKETYEDSVLRFMRALAREELSKKKYRLFLGNQPINEKNYIKVTPLGEDYFVSVDLRKKLNIYKKGKQSSIESFVDEFYIDSFGNHFPSDKVRFGGDFGVKRMGDTLPLDYLDIDAKEKEAN